MSELRLEHPLWLFFLLPLALATLISLRQERRSAVLYSSVQLLSALPITLAQRVRWLLPWLRFSALVLIVAALARPQHGLQDFRVRTEGIAVVMCLDRSGSMMALDFELDGERVNRLEAVKRVFRDFVVGNDRLAGRPDDLIGLVSFGGFAEAKSPLTLDHGALLQVLESVEIAQPVYDAQQNVINRRYLEEEQATAIGDAVALAVDRLKDSSAKSKVLILLSDGKQTAGVVAPEAAAEAAREFGIKIYAIGVGSTGRAPFPRQDPFGRTVLVPQPVELDEATLKMMAEQAGGRYFNAKDTGALQDVYTDIDKLEKTVAEGRLYTEYRELFQWLLIPGLALFILDVVLRWTRFRSLP
jgi:Ca-activated chloride channel family protein